MCGSNPELSPEVNSAKCIGGTALGFAIVTLIGFAIVPWGLVSALAGFFGVIAGSIVCCCGPKAKGEGDGKMNAAGILFIVAAVAIHCIAIILPIVGFLRRRTPPRRPPATTSAIPPTLAASARSPRARAPPGRPVRHRAPRQLHVGGGGRHRVIAIFAWPVMIFALMAMILEIVGAVKCMKAKKAILAEGGPSVK